MSYIYSSILDSYNHESLLAMLDAQIDKLKRLRLNRHDAEAMQSMSEVQKP